MWYNMAEEVTVSEIRFVSNITKEYEDMFKIVIYKEPKPFIVPDCRTIGKRRDVSDQDYKPKVSSLRRTKTTVQDIVLCNSFDLFCTFTFNPRKVDRYNFSECSSCMRRWFSHQRERSLKYGRELKYLVIPEQHKDGAWHFHALMSGYSSTLHDTGLKTNQLRTIYNITSFRLGYTTAVKIDSNAGVSSYITKYITKAFVSRYNGKKFFCSHGLKRPVRQVNSSLFRRVYREAPLICDLVGETPSQWYYHIRKSDLSSVEPHIIRAGHSVRHYDQSLQKPYRSRAGHSHFSPFEGDIGGGSNVLTKNPHYDTLDLDIMSHNIE